MPLPPQLWGCRRDHHAWLSLWCWRLNSDLHASLVKWDFKLFTFWPVAFLQLLREEHFICCSSGSFRSVCLLVCHFCHCWGAQLSLMSLLSSHISDHTGNHSEMLSFSLRFWTVCSKALNNTRFSSWYQLNSSTDSRPDNTESQIF